VRPSRNKPVGIIVAQLGTPAAPTASALRPYLAQFLSDMRVIDYSPLVWQPLLRGIILRRRPARSARLYSRIWTDEGSPLFAETRKQVEGLQARLGDGYRVVMGMRYGEPCIEGAMRTLEAEGIERILVFSMFPQFSSTTTASIYDAAALAANGRTSPLRHDRKRFIPALRYVPPYYDDPLYIGALKTVMDEQIAQRGRPEKFLITFHGIPLRYVRTGDPYRRQCGITAGLLAQAMHLKPGEWRVSFQSQFGPEPWLQPYTEDTLEHLGQKKIESLLVTCPGFTADCLETLDEIGNEGAESFHEAGGGRFTLAPCLNAHPAWLDAMAQIARRETMGWVDAGSSANQHDSGPTLEPAGVAGAGVRRGRGGAAQGAAAR
jgi:protoporphyrin/coproporphyrin ferrochelatase